MVRPNRKENDIQEGNDGSNFRDFIQTLGDRTWRHLQLHDVALIRERITRRDEAVALRRKSTALLIAFLMLFPSLPSLPLLFPSPPLISLSLPLPSSPSPSLSILRKREVTSCIIPSP